jgi:hypothetical protein
LCQQFDRRSQAVVHMSSSAAIVVAVFVVVVLVGFARALLKP